MMNNKLLDLNSIFSLWNTLEKKRKSQFRLLLYFQGIASFLDMSTVGLIGPFISILIDPDHFIEKNTLPFLSNLKDYITISEFISAVTIVFCVAIFVTGLLRLFVSFAQSKVVFAAGSELSSDIYYAILNKDYEFYKYNNSSTLINIISNKSTSIIYETIIPLIIIITSLFSIFVLSIVLFCVDPYITLLMLSFGAIIYLLVIRIVSYRLYKNSKIVSDEAANSIRALQEGLGGIRHVIIDELADYYLEEYRSVDLKWREAQANTLFIATSPRYFIESIALIALAVLAFNMAGTSHGLIDNIPIFAAFMLGIQKLLPLMQQLYHAIASLKGSQQARTDILSLLQNNDNVKAQSRLFDIKFKRNITLNNVSFRYNADAPWIFKNASIKINKGDRIGFIGETGSGKSTLFDLINGLLIPETGSICIDEVELTPSHMKSWRRHIGHVDQSVFLSDNTFKRNIALGVPDHLIDHRRLERSADLARIADFIHGFPAKYDAFIGEKGSLLSGGQRQRLGIARALYKRAELLLLDEATNALDIDTELDVVKSIDSLPRNLTVLIISHSLSSLNHCDRIYRILGTGEIQMVNGDLFSNVTE